jgi:hypothetical protein
MKANKLLPIFLFFYSITFVFSASAQKVTNFGTIKHTQSPKTWTIIVPKNYSKVEVAVYPYGKNVTNKYGGWNGSLKVNGKYVWKFKNFVKGKGGIIHDYLLGKEVLENSGKGSYCDVTGLAKSGSNKITYAHYGGGPGMGVKARITKKGTGGSSEKRTGGSYTSELVKFSNSMAKNKKYTNAGIVKIYDKNTIIKLFGSKVLKLANDAGFAGADLLKPSNWAKLYSKGPVKYFFNNNKDIMINVCLVAYTHSFSGYAGFVVVHTSSRGIDSYKVYALVYKQQFRKIGENGAPEFVRRPGWMKILIGNFSWHTLPAKFRKNLPNDMK